MKGRQRRKFGRYYDLKHNPVPTLYMLYMIVISVPFFSAKWVLFQDVTLSEMSQILVAYVFFFYPYLKWSQFYFLDRKDYDEKIRDKYDNCADICFVLLLMIYFGGMLLALYNGDYIYSICLFGLCLSGLLVFFLERCCMKKLFNLMDKKHGNTMHIN